MTTCRILAILLLFTVLLVRPAAPGWAAEPFDMFIVPTVDERLDSWLRVPSSLDPTIYSPEKVYPGQPFDLRVLFKGYAVDTEGRADISYDVRIIGPDGKPTGDSGDGLQAYRDRVGSRHAIIINRQYLSVVFDASYPYGNYTIRVLARDNVGRHTIARSRTLSLAPFRRVAAFASRDVFAAWIRDYFRQPDAAKAVFGLLQFIEAEPDWSRANPRLAAFAARLLGDNPWLREHLAALFRDHPGERDRIIALTALGGDACEVAKVFDPEQKALCERLRSSRLPPISDRVDSASQIDVLWGQFYVTGHLVFVEKIVRALEPFPLRGALQDDFIPETAPEAAFWTLVVHGRENSLVAGYGRYLLEHGRLAPENAIQLRLALDVIEKALGE